MEVFLTSCTEWLVLFDLKLKTDDMTHRITTIGALGIAGLLIASQQSRAVSVGALPDLGQLTPYAVFGNDINANNVAIHGNTGIGNNGHLQLEAPSSINGNLDRGTGSTAAGGGYPANVSGTITTGLNLTGPQAQLQAASTTLAGLTPNVTIGGTVTTGHTFGTPNGVPDVFVINLVNVALGSGQNFNFAGDASDFYVLNISGDLDMNGNAAIGSSGQASHILLNLTTSGTLGNVAHIGNVINATTLIPDATYAEFHSVNGAIYGGDGEVKLMSGAKVEYMPFTKTPESVSTALALLLGAGVLVGIKNKVSRA
jgi:hypothetical protein